MRKKYTKGDTHCPHTHTHTHTHTQTHTPFLQPNPFYIVLIKVLNRDRLSLKILLNSLTPPNLCNWNIIQQHQQTTFPKEGENIPFGLYFFCVYISDCTSKEMQTSLSEMPRPVSGGNLQQGEKCSERIIWSYFHV